jgi:hypothetical protein
MDIGERKGHNANDCRMRLMTKPESLFVVNTGSKSAVRNEFVTVDGEPYICIRHVDQLNPFLMSVVSDNDHWLFVGSNSPFTAGRIDPDHALFPYQTADKILRHPDTSGAFSAMLVRAGERWVLWEPWQASGRIYCIDRHLYKHIHGASVIFEEINHDLGLRFRWNLSTCEPYGFVRECVLERLHDAPPVEVRYLDGWHQLLPPGVDQETFGRLSYLAEAYMRHECGDGELLGIFTLNAAITDRAEACESLRAACSWSIGHAHPVILLSKQQVPAFCRGEFVRPEHEIRGEFGAYLVADSVTIAPGDPHHWFMVADTGFDHAALVRLRHELKEPAVLAHSLRQSLTANRNGLRRRIAAADGLQQTADQSASVHHFANVLFNCMRGGVFNDSYRFSGKDFADFVRVHSTIVHAGHQQWLEELPELLALAQLHREVAKRKDVHLLRLAHEYLPLSFSRRHGDPSRPWNRFDIHIKDEEGRPLYAYQGNWRDIFQNWESLAQSYPAWLGQMIRVFLNASTADGYNPYRITRNGVDWEISDPKDPWSHIGYWGDHQIVYLLRLLESQERFQPGQLASQLRAEACVYAHVPYEIDTFDEIVADPRHTITFNHSLHQLLMSRARQLGADGKLLTDDRGEIVLVSLAEKLLVPLLVKLSNFVPGGGIWLNTQRPEWNDANNALAGWGLSMVTVCHLRRYLKFCDRIFAASGDKPVPLSAPAARLLADITSILLDAAKSMEQGFDDASRFQLMAALGRAGEKHRHAIYTGGKHDRKIVPLGALRGLVEAALPVIESTIRGNRRRDGLFHSYNVLHLDGDRARVAHLYPMLEGQVAVLSSGLLNPAEALIVLRALRASALYRADQHSYLLYPDRELPSFFDRNTLTGRPPLKDPSLFVTDEQGRWHFQADLRSASDVAKRLESLQTDEDTQKAVLELWEATFRHSEFTGRSGTFFAFEGLGSIYWHMVVKLLLAAQECHREALREGSDPDVTKALAEAYDDIRQGLGFCKTPDAYGAFPTDPYSHSPRHRGAQQPGMTGQVKEEILTRWGELGIAVEDGKLCFAPRLLHQAEFFPSAQRFLYLDVQNEEQSWELPANSLGFTYCQVPISYRLADDGSILVERADGTQETIRGNTLGAADSVSVFTRTGKISRLTVFVPRTDLRP